MEGAGEYAEGSDEESRPVRGEGAYGYAEGAYGDGGGYAEYGAGEGYASGAAAAAQCTSSMVLCSAAVAARRWAGAARSVRGSGPRRAGWADLVLGALGA